MASAPLHPFGCRCSICTPVADDHGRAKMQLLGLFAGFALVGALEAGRAILPLALELIR